MSQKTTIKIYYLLLSILAMGALPFFHIDLRYISKALDSSAQIIGSYVGLAFWIGIIMALIYGVLKRKGMVIEWSFAILGVSIVTLIKHIFIFGSYGKESLTIISSVVFVILFYLLRNQDVRSEFP